VKEKFRQIKALNNECLFLFN